MRRAMRPPLSSKSGGFILQGLTDGDRAWDGTEGRAHRVDDQIDAALQAEGGIRLKDQSFNGVSP